LAFAAANTVGIGFVSKAVVIEITP
jgi:hypothetical protein